MPPLHGTVALVQVHHVEGDDGRWRLPPSVEGELPVFFSILASKLSEKDADYLASLANDRSDRVKAVARSPQGAGQRPRRRDAGR